LFFASTYIFVFSTSEVHGAELRIVKSFDFPPEGVLTPYGRPQGLAWDGRYLWHSTSDDSFKAYGNKIFKLDANGCNIVDEIQAPSSAAGLSWDGEYLWCASSSLNRIYKLNSSTGRIVDSIDSPGNTPRGLEFDGEYLWNADIDDAKIYKLNPSTGEVVDSFDSPGDSPTGLAFNGEYLWNADFDDAKIYKLNPSTGEVVDSFDSPGNTPRGLAWDGRYLWNVDGTTLETRYGAKIYQLDVSPSPEIPFCLGSLAISIFIPVTLIAVRILKRHR